jgi:hypothetical protein
MAFSVAQQVVLRLVLQGFGLQAYLDKRAPARSIWLDRRTIMGAKETPAFGVPPLPTRAAR